MAGGSICCVHLWHSPRIVLEICPRSSSRLDASIHCNSPFNSNVSVLSCKLKQCHASLYWILEFVLHPRIPEPKVSRGMCRPCISLVVHHVNRYLWANHRSHSGNCSNTFEINLLLRKSSEPDTLVTRLIPDISILQHSYESDSSGRWVLGLDHVDSQMVVNILHGIISYLGMEQVAN